MACAVSAGVRIAAENRPSVTAAAPVRRCACGRIIGPGGECDRCRRRGLEREHARPAAAVGLALEVLRLDGQPLGAPLRGAMESRYGHDFAHVRVHADARAADSAAALGAAAYSLGRDVVVGAGAYPPTTPSQTRLLAHELMHVVQAAPAGRAPAGWTLLAGGRATVGRPGDAAEREADRAVGEEGATVTRRDAGVVRRQPAGDGPTRQEQELDARLRRLATRPGRTLEQWKSLAAEQRTYVVLLMVQRYGIDFARAFQEYASGRKKPNIATRYSNSASDNPRALRNRGYRHVPGTQVWVHPSGHEVEILSAPAPSGTPPPEPEPESEEDFRARCVERCAETDDEDSCNACCDQIPKEDPHCIEGCRATCSNKL
jgi:hypothetical protein